MSKKFFWGFSLAELLIALAIVGIIAAVTIPGVVTNYNQKAMLTQLQKNYVELQETLLMLKTENYHKGLEGSILNNKGSKSVEETAGKFLKDYYKITQDCNTDTQPCFAKQYADISTVTYKDFSCDGYSVNVASGAAICIIPASIFSAISIDPSTLQPSKVETKNPVVVYLDVNGAKGPNIGGRDMFTFNIYNDYSIDEVDVNKSDSESSTSPEDERNNLYNSNCLTSNVGKGCFGKILNDNWQVNY